MAGGKITASLVVQFGGADDGGDGNGSIKAELDNRPGGLNGGKTQFGHDDPIWFLVFLDNAVIDRIITTSGSVGGATPALAEKKDSVLFDEAAEGELSYSYAAGASVEWLGASGGTPTFTVGSTKVTIPVAAFAMANIAYKSACTAYRLSGVPVDVDAATIKIIGHALS